MARHPEAQHMPEFVKRDDEKSGCNGNHCQSFKMDVTCGFTAGHNVFISGSPNKTSATGKIPLNEADSNIKRRRLAGEMWAKFSSTTTRPWIVKSP
jgi:hypothetical protein